MFNSVKYNVEVVDSSFDPESGISLVKIKTPYGAFCGKAKMHPDDTPFASRFAGCQLAEMRAYIKYIKARVREVDSQIKILRHLDNTLNEMRGIEPDNAYRKIYRFIKELEEERKYWKDQIDMVNNLIQETISTRETICKRIEKANLDKNN